MYGLLGVNASTTFMKTSSIIKQYGIEPTPTHQETKGKYNEISNELYGGIGFNKTIANHWKLNVQCMMMYNSGAHYSYYTMNDYSPKAQVGILYSW